MNRPKRTSDTSNNKQYYITLTVFTFAMASLVHFNYIILSPLYYISSASLDIYQQANVWRDISDGSKFLVEGEIKKTGATTKDVSKIQKKLSNDLVFIKENNNKIISALEKIKISPFVYKHHSKLEEALTFTDQEIDHLGWLNKISTLDTRYFYIESHAKWDPIRMSLIRNRDFNLRMIGASNITTPIIQDIVNNLKRLWAIINFVFIGCVALFHFFLVKPILRKLSYANNKLLLHTERISDLNACLDSINQDLYNESDDIEDVLSVIQSNLRTVFDIHDLDVSLKEVSDKKVYKPNMITFPVYIENQIFDRMVLESDESIPDIKMEEKTFFRAICETLSSSIVRTEKYSLIKERNFSQSILTKLFEADFGGICIIDPNQTIKMCNPAFLAINNKDKQDVIDQQAQSYFLNTLNFTVDQYDSLLNGYPVNIKTFNNRVLQYTAFDINQADYKGGKIIVIYDKTHIVNLETAMNESNKMKALGRFSTGVIHDFNNILFMILNNLAVLDVMGGDSEQKKVIHDAREACTQGTRLTSKLLDYAQERKLMPEAIALNEIESVVKHWHTQVPMTLSLTIDNRLDRQRCIYADTALLVPSLHNLLNNAVHAVQGNNAQELTVHICELTDQVHGLPYAYDQYVSISVIDNGTGFTKDGLEKAVEPFYTTKEIGMGVGIGLATVYAFAEQSQGKLLLNNRSDNIKGAEVSIVLPLDQCLLESA